MREPVLLKVPGAKMPDIERLINFINSDANRPVDDITGGALYGGRALYKRYMKLLGMEIDSSKDESDPSYKLSLTILTEHGVRNNAGGTDAQTPRGVIEEIFDRLRIFPKNS